MSSGSIAEDPEWEGRGFLYHGFRVYDVCGARAGNVCATESRDRRAAIDYERSKVTQAGLTRQSNPQIAQTIRPEFQNWIFPLDPE
jgi:hypothetical protein